MAVNVYVQELLGCIAQPPIVVRLIKPLGLNLAKACFNHIYILSTNNINCLPKINQSHGHFTESEPLSDLEPQQHNHKSKL